MIMIQMKIMKQVKKGMFTGFVLLSKGKWG